MTEQEKRALNERARKREKVDEIMDYLYAKPESVSHDSLLTALELRAELLQHKIEVLQRHVTSLHALSGNIRRGQVSNPQLSTRDAITRTEE